MKLYDETSPKSIEEYAKTAVKKSFIEILEGKDTLPHDYDAFNAILNSSKNKGALGNIVEKYHFGYEPNSSSLPDFPKAGVELKVAPFVIGKTGQISAKERLVITIISYMDVIKEEFEESHVYNKMSNILLMEYLHEFDKSKADFRIYYAGLLNLPTQDLLIIKKDFETIIDKIKRGEAHNLSEGDTLYLGACTKGATATTSLRDQPFSSIKAKQRAFSLKNSYMSYYLRTYIFPNGFNVDSIEEKSVKKKIDLPEKIITEGNEVDSFEDYIVDRINSYKGKTSSELLSMFNIETNAKNTMSMLAFRMLGIKSNDAEEFVKANIVVKTIRLEYDFTIKESMSFPTFQYLNVAAEEEWEDSQLYSLWSDTKFLFVIYKTDDKNKNSKNKEYKLYDCQFWNVPYEDLMNDAQTMWLNLRKVIRDGLKIEIINGRKHTNLPGKSDNPMCHVRPKAKDSTQTNQLPDGRYHVNHCYFMNNDYILKQLDCVKNKKK